MNEPKYQFRLTLKSSIWEDSESSSNDETFLRNKVGWTTELNKNLQLWLEYITNLDLIGGCTVKTAERLFLH